MYLHYAADVQLHCSLLYRGPKLVDTGLFARTRTPNYFGNVLIYVSYGLLAQHWLAWAALSIFFFLFFPQLLANKDKSLSRHSGFAEYKQRSWLLLPKLTGRDFAELFVGEPAPIVPDKQA